jgi:hypothetical protein
MTLGDKAAQKEESGEELTDEEKIFLAFFHEVEAAESALEQGLTGSIVSAALRNRDWRAALAYLERRNPEWKPKAHYEVDGELGEASPERAAALVQEAFGKHGAMNAATSLGEGQDRAVPEPDTE